MTDQWSDDYLARMAYRPDPKPESPLLGTIFGVPLYWGPVPESHAAVAVARQAADESAEYPYGCCDSDADVPARDDGAGMP